MIKRVVLLAMLIYFMTGWSDKSLSPVNKVCAEERNQMVLKVKKTKDFQVSGDGKFLAWDSTDWLSLPQRRGKDSGYQTGVKVLYSDSGIYFLFRCTDGILKAALQADFMDLWKEDVVEVFIWPDEKYPVYFEYELSPLDRELVLLVPNFEGNLWGWRPWHYEGDRLVHHATAVQGGKKESGSKISEWTAEIFVPFALLKPLQNVPPRPGTEWRANFYRCDYDTGENTYWSWQPVEKRFHEYKKFGTLVFE
jgi:hypothetical protein